MAHSSSKETAAKTLVIGIGNEYRSDDGVGILVVRKLRKLNLSNIEIAEEPGDGARIIELWKEQKSVILVDAAQSGSEPGTIYRFEVSKNKIPAKLFKYSSHNFSVPQALEIAKSLNQLPKRVVIYGVEGKEFSDGTDMSPAVKRMSDYVVDLIIEELKIPHVK